MVLVIAATVWSDRRRFARAVGRRASPALALAIGLREPAAVGAVRGSLRVALPGRSGCRDGVAQIRSLALAAGTLVGFLFRERRRRRIQDRQLLRGDRRRDSTAAVVAAAGLGLCLASARPVARKTSGCAASRWPAGLGAPAHSGFICGSSRACSSAGPFAIMDPTVRSLFLMDISEMQSLGRMLRLEPLERGCHRGVPGARPAGRRAGGARAAARFRLPDRGGARSCSPVRAPWSAVIKFYNYALWLGVPLVAVAAHQVFVRLRLHSVVAQFAASLLVTPMAVTLGAITIASAAGTAEGLDINSPERQACVNAENYAPLARLPKGLMAMNALEWGPYLVAFTPQSVLAAPNHIRLGDAILASNAVFALQLTPRRGASGGGSRRGRLRGDLRYARTSRSLGRANSREPLGATQGRRGSGLARAGARARRASVHRVSRPAARGRAARAVTGPAQVLAARRLSPRIPAAYDLRGMGALLYEPGRRGGGVLTCIPGGRTKGSAR